MRTPSSSQLSQTDLEHGRSTSSTEPSLPLKVPALLSTLALISIVLLALVGGGLFFFPQFIQDRWIWPLTPFNTRFLGAIYLTALVSLTNLIFGNRAVLARLIVPMMWIFTTVVLLASCLHLEQFSPLRRASDLWFWVYLIDCVGASYYLGYFKERSFPNLRQLPALWPAVLGIQAGLLGVYGLGFLIFPETTSSTWSWPLDSFHARLYSSIFLTGAVGSALLAKRASAAECRALGVIQITFSGLVLAGVGIVDSAVNKMDWRLLANWIWVGAISLPGIIGLGLILQVRRQSES